MKNLMKLMLLPVFLLASLSAFAKAPVFDGTAWDASFTPSNDMSPLVIKKGMYYFDDALVGQETMKLTATDTIAPGAVPKIVSGKWTFTKIGIEEGVKGSYSRVITADGKVDGKVIAKLTYSLTVTADTVNTASGKLTIKKYTAGGFEESTSVWNVKLAKIPSPQ